MEIQGFDEFKKRAQTHKRQRSEKQVIVDDILKLVGGETKEYNYAFWLKAVGKRSYGEMQAILKDVSNAPVIYPKGALLTKRLFKK